jgi:hypothetical protein
MKFGAPEEFSIEVYHEPSAAQWAGFGRMAIDVHGTRLGNNRENHCSLFHAVDQIRHFSAHLEDKWDQAFDGLSDGDIFRIIDRSCYTGDIDEDYPDYSGFDFLTNTGEQFDDYKTFLVCPPGGKVHVLYQMRDETIGSACCSIADFRSTSEDFVRWFDVQVKNVSPPYYPINPLNPDEEVSPSRDA